MTQPTAHTDLSAERLEAFQRRDRARALNTYAHNMHNASMGLEQPGRFGGRPDDFRADARAALHAFPELLALVEG